MQKYRIFCQPILEGLSKLHSKRREEQIEQRKTLRKNVFSWEKHYFLESVRASTKKCTQSVTKVSPGMPYLHSTYPQAH